MKVILTGYLPAMLLAVALPVARSQESRPQAPAAAAQVKPPAPTPGIEIDPLTGLPQYRIPGEAGTRRVEQVKIQEQPLPEVVDTLRKLYPELNFVLPPSVVTPKDRDGKDRDCFVLSFVLRNACLGDMLNAITYATDEAVTWKLVGDSLVVFQLRPDRVPSPPPPSVAPPVRRSFQVVNLSTLIGADVEDVRRQRLIEEVRTLTIETLMRLYDGFDVNTQMCDCSYHAGTGVLVLVGPDTAIKVFIDILQRADKPKPSAKDSGKAKTEPAAPPAPVPTPAAPPKPK